MLFWNTLAFLVIQLKLEIFSVSSAFSKTSLNIWKFTVHILLKPGLENFEHYFTSMWDECNCAVVWAFFGIAFLWDWNENWPFPVAIFKIWLRLISSFRPVYASPLTCSLFTLFSSLSGEKKAPFLFLLQHNQEQCHNKDGVNAISYINNFWLHG